MNGNVRNNQEITVEMSTDFNQQRKYQYHSIGENTIFIEYNFVKEIGPQTIVCAFYESLHVAEQFATNFIKINQGIRKL